MQTYAAVGLPVMEAPGLHLLAASASSQPYGQVVLLGQTGQHPQVLAPAALAQALQMTGVASQLPAPAPGLSTEELARQSRLLQLLQARWWAEQQQHGAATMQQWQQDRHVVVGQAEQATQQQLPNRLSHTALGSAAGGARQVDEHIQPAASHKRKFLDAHQSESTGQSLEHHEHSSEHHARSKSGSARDATKERNRQAQRRFRARHKELVAKLNEQVEQLQQQVVSQGQELQSLKTENALLLAKLKLCAHTWPGNLVIQGRTGASASTTAPAPGAASSVLDVQLSQLSHSHAAANTLLGMLHPQRARASSGVSTQPTGSSHSPTASSTHKEQNAVRAAVPAGLPALG